MRTRTNGMKRSAAPCFSWTAVPGRLQDPQQAGLARPRVCSSRCRGAVFRLALKCEDEACQGPDPRDLSRRALVKAALASAGLCNVYFLRSDRAAAEGLTSTTTPALSKKYQQLRRRLDDEAAIKQAGVAPFAEEQYFPAWMNGEWNVHSTIWRVLTPQGDQLANADAARVAFADIGRTVDYSLRFKPVQREGDAQPRYVPDRVFNTISSTNAFAGRPVIASVSIENSRPKRLIALYRGATGARSLQFVNNRSAEIITNPDGKPEFICSESYRQVFYNPSSDRGPVTTDYEIIQRFVQVNEKRLEGTLRVAVYLQPLDQKYFDAGNKAVLMTDSTIVLDKLQPGEGSV
ncbi:hypothetical protein FVE85_2884 [Porphyridium purpureum]|uniref:DUF6816 domain-containing protein n=1 Tax=Porphyridium purpureum TaxID=35688 RepID=A0A5J4YV56_PORPP|nr:hypothetical protein FVE85_2884 [Porphyridium purpureum]|eukprot:POR5907..scf227_4